MAPALCARPRRHGGAIHATPLAAGPPSIHALHALHARGEDYAGTSVASEKTSARERVRSPRCATMGEREERAARGKPFSFPLAFGVARRPETVVRLSPRAG